MSQPQMPQLNSVPAAMPTASFVPPQHVCVSGKKIGPEEAAQRMAVLTPVIAEQIRAVAVILNVTPSDAEVDTLVGKMSTKLRQNKSMPWFKPDGEALNFSAKIQQQLPVLQDYKITPVQWWNAIKKQPQLLQILGDTLREKMAQMVPVLSDQNVGRLTPPESRLHNVTGINRILKDPRLLNLSTETLRLSQLYTATFPPQRGSHKGVVIRFGHIRRLWRKKAGLDKGQVPDPKIVAAIAAKQAGRAALTKQEIALLIVSAFKQRRKSG